MQWIKKLTHAVKIKTILFSLSILIFGNLALNYFLLHPGEQMAQNLKKKLAEFRNTYVQLKSTNMTEIKETLADEVEYLKQKKTKLFANSMSIEQVPLFITQLSRTADIIGLRITSSVEKQKKSKPDQLNFTFINLNYNGTFQQVLSFLNELETWDEILLIKEFHINKSNIINKDISGYLKFMTINSNN